MAHPAVFIRDLVGDRVGRFVIKSRLGAGGMGEVFLGEDSLLKRAVAMKVIRREHSLDQRFRERLLKEAERASQLNNEHVAAIYDVVEDDERIFLVMEYVEGQTLRSLLREPLPLQQFFSIAEQCLSGLAAAHERGILHCDLKPENLMITPSGVLKILDFGFARRVETQNTDTKDTLSVCMTGGTPGYVAPEVMLGKTPDQRADIYSLGVVFHELLTGKRPTQASSDTRPRPSLPEPSLQIDQIIAGMLAGDPACRYSNCAGVLADIRAVQAGGKVNLARPSIVNKALSWRRVPPLLGLAILAVLFIYRSSWRMPWSPEPVAAGSRELVVLPFQPPQNADSNSRAFADGLTETLSAKLGQVTDRYPLQIIPASEVRAQKVSDAQHARTILGATLVLRGNLQRSGDTVRVTYSLVDTHSLRQIDSGVITADAANVFAVQDRVIQQVLNDLDIELAKAERGSMLSHGTTQARAYDLYLRGRGYLQQYDRKENLENAITAFQQSTESDPGFALAYAGLGRAYILMYVLEHRPALVTQANRACARAAHFEEQNAAAELCIGMLLNATGKYESAAQHLESSLKLDSNCDQCYRELSMAYEELKRSADAEAILKRDIKLHPQQWAGYKRLGSFYASLGRYDEAVSAFNEVVKLAPDSIGGYSNLGAVYVVQGKYADATKALEKSIAIQPTAPALSNLGAAYFYLRKYQDAARTYEQAAQLSPNEYEIFGNLAEAYAQIEGAQEKSRREYARALNLAEERLKVNSRDGAVRMDAALYAAILGERTKALQYRKAGLKLSAENPEVWQRSALVLAQLHEDGRALADLQRALRAGLSPSEISNNPAWQRFSAYPEYKRMVRQTQTK